MLHSFTDGNDGGYPYVRLIKDAAGNLYGTTASGGADGAGTVFRLAPDGTETILYSFTGGSDGSNPVAGLIKDAKDNLYGTTFAGGTNNAGAVFKLAPDGTETVLHSFTGGKDGINPYARLIKDAAGNFYGTTYAGGADGAGTVFKVAPGGTETILHSFTGGSDGSNPVAGLIANKKGHLFGTTQLGGADGSGTVFELKE